MSAACLRFRAELRRRWSAWLSLALVIGVAAGATVAMASATHWTRGAYGRYLRATNAADAYANAGEGYGDPGLDVGRFARLPQVARSQRTLVLAMLARTRSGEPVNPVPPNYIQFQVPSDDRARDIIDVPVMLRGRLPDPGRPDEVLADPRALRVLGIGLGDRFTVRTVRQSLLVRDVDAFDTSLDPRSGRAARWGDLVTVRVVGVHANAKTDVDGGYIDFTPAFRRAHGGFANLGRWAEEAEVRLRHGSADADAFHRAVERAAHGRAHGFYDPATTRPVIRRSIGAVADALRLLTVVTAVAALVLGGQAVLRSAAFDARWTGTLRALGMTNGQFFLLSATRGALLAVPAIVATVAVAVLLSPLAPVGWARELDPKRGRVRLDPTAIGVGSAVVLVFLVGLCAFAGRGAARAGARDRRGPSSGLGRLTTALGHLGLPVSAATGVRMALSRQTPTSPVPVRATLATATAAVIVAVLALTFTHSAAHLLHTPRLYGQTWDYETYNGGPTPQRNRATARRRVVADLAVGFSGPVRVNDQSIGTRAVDDHKGHVEPTVLEGRAPRAASEALLGTKSLNALHRRIGDTITARGPHGAVRLRIVGRGVMPADKWTDLGQGLWMRLSALKRIDPGAPSAAVLVNLRPGVDRAAATRWLDRLYGGSVINRPQEVSDLGRVHGAPAVIGAGLGLAAAAALAHLLLTSVRRRRRDLALFKTLGFTRMQVQAAIFWQATTIAAIGVLIGLPLGLALGRFGWNLYADNLGVASEPIVPVGLSALLLPAAIVLANVVAAVPAWRAAATRPAVVLRVE
jgi:hypothetical protein